MNLFNNIFVQIIIAWVLSTIFFTALIIYIAKHPNKRATPLKIAFIFMFIGGMTLYCICHALEIHQAARELLNDSNVKYLKWVKSENASLLYIPYIIVRSVIDVGMMFYGRINSDLFYNLPISGSPLAVLFFWLIHLFAFYTTATALIIRFGNDLLRWIRIITSKISDIDLVYGINPDSLLFGRNIANTKGNMLVYVDNTAGEDYDSAIRDLGGIIYLTQDAVKAAPSFLKSIRIKPNKTRLRLFALSNEYDKNLQYAAAMLESLNKLGISPEQTELVLLGTDEWKGIKFQSSASQYGYGRVMSLDEYELTARLLINKYPLCDSVKFDKNGRAVEDMNVLIIGFGRMGHEVLRKVIANGQFEGSNFHATIYDPNFERRTGFVKSQYPIMFANYDIDFEPQDGRGNQIFKFIQDNAAKLKYIVICIEDRFMARGMAIRIVDRLQSLGHSQHVYTCDSKSVRCYSGDVKECQTHWIYDSELLYSGELDKYAMELNHKYSGGRNLYEDWRQCSYFDRMSSRASVDYLIPLIRRINAGELTHEQRENLAKSEHLRWCAFHYSFGFDVMDKSEFTERIKEYNHEIKIYGKSSIKLTKDKEKLKHVCLVDWDELDEISRIENSLTHANKNYKDSDRTNVDMIMELIQAKPQEN